MLGTLLRIIQNSLTASQITASYVTITINQHSETDSIKTEHCVLYCIDMIYLYLINWQIGIYFQICKYIFMPMLTSTFFLLIIKSSVTLTLFTKGYIGYSSDVSSFQQCIMTTCQHGNQFKHYRNI